MNDLPTATVKEFTIPLLGLFAVADSADGQAAPAVCRTLINTGLQAGASPREMETSRFNPDFALASHGSEPTRVSDLSCSGK